MLRVGLDTGHPLTVGMGDWSVTLKEGSRRLPVSSSGFVVARFDGGGPIGGAISAWSFDRIAGTPFMTHHSMGRGRVICFTDDLTIRGFFIGPRRLLLNAILLPTEPLARVVASPAGGRDRRAEHRVPSPLCSGASRSHPTARPGPPSPERPRS